jgi:GTP-binding protein
VRIEFRTGENPYEGKKNVLTPRQQARRKRLMRHVKKR